MLEPLVKAMAAKGDLAHLVLLFWAMSAQGLALWALRELTRSNRRFNDFVAELARFNALIGEGD